MKKITAVQFGLGPIGLESVRLAASHGAFDLKGGIDIDPQKIGRSLTDLIGQPSLENAKVWGSLEELLERTETQVILHTASSSAEKTLLQVRPALERGISVVSTCEELIFPALKHPQLTEEYHRLCQRTGARVVAAGVNPGFVMDLLPLVLTGISREVSSIYVERVVDASRRRQPLQAKVGSGQEPTAFAARLRAGLAGHAGFRESLALVAHAVGWTLDSITDECEPVVAQQRIVTDYFDVPAGRTCGIRQRCFGIVGDKAKISLSLQMSLGASNPHDTIVIEGKPHLNLTISNGVAGDDATVASLINVVPLLLNAQPGLKLLTDLQVPRWWKPIDRDSN